MSYWLFSDLEPRIAGQLFCLKLQFFQIRHCFAAVFLHSLQEWGKSSGHIPHAFLLFLSTPYPFSFKELVPDVSPTNTKNINSNNATGFWAFLVKKKTS